MSWVVLSTRQFKGSFVSLSVRFVSNEKVLAQQTIHWERTKSTPEYVSSSITHPYATLRARISWKILSNKTDSLSVVVVLISCGFCAITRRITIAFRRFGARTTNVVSHRRLHLMIRWHWKTKRSHWLYKLTRKRYAVTRFRLFTFQIVIMDRT